MTNTKHLRKILIVDDEGDMCLILEMILNKDQVSIDHVKKISAAEDYLKHTKPDLILLDNRLPDGLGIDFISFIKRFYPHSKIIMISGRDGVIKDLALANGADMFLLKPFSRAVLLEAVDRLLDAEGHMTDGKRSGSLTESKR
jgi:DNA-binding response OmpR family regulator